MLPLPPSADAYDRKSIALYSHNFFHLVAVSASFLPNELSQIKSLKKLNYLLQRKGNCFELN